MWLPGGDARAPGARDLAQGTVSPGCLLPQAEEGVTPEHGGGGVVQAERGAWGHRARTVLLPTPVLCWHVRPLGVTGEETWGEAGSVPSSPASRALCPLQEGPSQGTAFWLPGGPAVRGTLWPRVPGLGVWAGARVESLPRLLGFDGFHSSHNSTSRFQVTEKSGEIIFKGSLQISCFYLFR